MSEKQGRCATCAHWAENEPHHLDVRQYPGFRECQNFDKEGPPTFVTHGPLYTHKSFGCCEWKGGEQR